MWLLRRKRRLVRELMVVKCVSSLFWVGYNVMTHLSSVRHVYLKVSEENVVVLSRWGAPHLFPTWTWSWSIAVFKVRVIGQGQQSRLWRKRVARYDSLCSELDCKALWKWSVTKIKTLFFFFLHKRIFVKKLEHSSTNTHGNPHDDTLTDTWKIKKLSSSIKMTAPALLHGSFITILSMIHTDTRRRFYRWPLY